MVKKQVSLFLSACLMLIIACTDSTDDESSDSVGCSDCKDEIGILYGFYTKTFSHSDSPTDLTINGNGLFMLRQPTSNDLFYTRYGSFEINDEGFLVNNQGYIVQGWETDEDGDTTGSTKDIQFIYNLSPITLSDLRETVTIDPDGLIAYFDYDRGVITAYRISLVKFMDNHSLLQLDSGIYQETFNSGPATISLPESNGLGLIVSYALEERDPEQTFETYVTIKGQGYMIVRDPDSSEQHYFLKSGDFRFNRNGQIVNRDGYILQGWELEENEDTGEFEITGSVSDMGVTAFTSQPLESDIIQLITNLDTESENYSPGTSALSQAWNGDTSLDQHIDATSYEFSETAGVYDVLGSRHVITFYFDKGEGDRTFEYIITCNPEEDIRFGLKNGPDYQRGNGLLGRGKISFTSEGEISDLTFEELVSADPDAIGAWEYKDASEDLFNNHYQITADFVGGVSTQQLIEIDFGVQFDGSSWIPDAVSTTSYSQQSGTIVLYSNGYGAKDLSRCTINRLGHVTGYYSSRFANDLEVPFFGVALASFVNPDKLEEISENIYMETESSGDYLMAVPDTLDLGTLEFRVH
ncbi:MAG: flagellar hook-basal body complex protein [Desulfobacteraceae bacterium]